MNSNKSISLIIPFYKKLEEFKIVFPYNYKTVMDYSGNKEIIISLDENSSEQELVDFLSNYNGVDIHIIINDVVHDWRNPSKPINVGIKNANMDCSLVISPESLMDRNFLTIMSERKKDDNFVIGVLKRGLIIDGELGDSLQYRRQHYGSILFSNIHAKMVNGYTESFYRWGGEDDDFRARLVRAGIHKHHTCSGVTHYQIKGKVDGVTRSDFNRRRFERNKRIVTNVKWGEDFNRKISLYKTN